VTDSTHIAQKEGYADIGDKIVITAGVPFGKPGTTNILRIATIGSDNSL
jgi:pyruvate kinase